MSLRDRLRGRQLPQASVGIRLDWSEESYAVLREADAAEQRLQNTKINDPQRDAIREEAAEARAKADSFFETVTVRALPAAEFEELLNAHQPTAEQSKDGFAFNRDTFFPALLARCVEGTETAEEWIEMISSGELIMGEVGTLFTVAMELNDRSPNVTLGKGSTTTHS